MPPTPESQKQRTQSSLTSFFRPKPTPSQLDKGKTSVDAVDLTQSPPPGQPLSPSPPPPSSPPSKRARLADGSARAVSSSSASSHPVTASSYFAPQSHTATGGSSSSSSHKRHRSITTTNTTTIALDSFRLAKLPVAASDTQGSAFGDFGLHSSTPHELPPPTQRTAEEESRHERWQRLAGNIMPRRRSLALDEAAASEARRAAGIDTPEGGVGDRGDEDEDGEAKATAAAVSTKLREKYAVVDTAPKKGRKKKEDEVGPSGMTYTPLEKQFMEIKKKWPDVLIFMEVGYKYKFHGDDAKNASKELGIAAFPSRNFYVASIPTHRLHIHVKKLISLGYKVGVVSQMETAALKKIGDNRNTPFVRELTHLYTATTYVEEDSSSSSNLRDQLMAANAAPQPTNALVAIVEHESGDRSTIALVSVVPGTSDVVWDEFDDSPVRSELETRLAHLQPSELILPERLSKPTEKVLKHLVGAARSAATVRVERIKMVPDYNTAFDQLTKFYKKSSKKSSNGIAVDLTGDDEDGEDGHRSDIEVDEVPAASQTDRPIDLAAGVPAKDAVLALVDFPKQVVVALAMTFEYMTAFGLQNALRHRSSFTQFINRAHMLLSGNTLANLEIYRNQTDGGQRGSLLWLLDHTKSRMGRRLMREWIGRPLLDVAALQARSDAVEEIMSTNNYHLEKLRSLLVNMPDLVRGLTRVQYAKATPTELSTILVGLVRVGSEFTGEEGKLFFSGLLNSIVATLPTIAKPSKDFLAAIDLKAAKANNEADLWTDPDRYPEIQDAKDCIAICDTELDQHLREVRKVLRNPALKYVTVSGIDFLIEVPVRNTKAVPPKWVKVQSTKSVARFHTPEIIDKIKEREQHKETLAVAAKRAFASFQNDVCEHHAFVLVSRQLAVIDCLVSLASVALTGGYTKPTFVAEPNLTIKAGRHPMVESLRDEAYVPFDIEFNDKEGCAKVITGPNMAGKSSCVRATALIVCMAQIGSFVPAEAVTLGIHDAVQTRMGASDDIGRGKSTFMVEMSETSDILRTVSPRTLVILDELGRGTSTYDGVAIAYATLAHLAEVGCKTLFVTHYPLVAEQLANEHPNEISNWHMAFSESKLADGCAEITFLYKLKRGLADASFGVWCARLAGLPGPLLVRAQERADDLKRDTRERGLAALARRFKALTTAIENGEAGLKEAERVESVLQFQRA